MITIIVISFLAVLGAASTLYLRRGRTAFKTDNEQAPSVFAGLFANQKPPVATDEDSAAEASRCRVGLLDRARDGDLTTLTESKSTRDEGLYCDALNALVDSTSGDSEKLRALASYISSNHELRGNKRLAELVMVDWEAAPDRRSTIEMIHLAALSDDAATYQRAVELVISFCQKSKLIEFRSEDLIELFESQFWILAPEARQGGAGFALKQSLAGVRRELATMTPVRS